MDTCGSRIRVTTTATGNFFSLFALVCLCIGVGCGLKELVIVSLFLMVVFLAARHVVRWNVAGLSVTQSLPTVVYAREQFVMTLTVVDSGGRLDVCGIELRHQAVIGRDRGRQHIERITRGGYARCSVSGRVNRRGLVGSFRCGLWSTYPFGLWCARRDLELPCRLVVAPQPLMIRECPGLAGASEFLQGAQSSAAVERVGEFRSLREYRHGDPAKMISWSRSAQLNRLIVREAERLSTARVRVLFHSYQPPGVMVQPKGVERSLQRLTGVFELLRREGIAFDFQGAFSDWNVISGAEGNRLSPALLECLAGARFVPSSDLDEVIGAIRAADGVVGSVIVVSPVPLRHWGGLLAASRVCVVCMDNHGFQGTVSTAGGWS